MERVHARDRIVWAAEDGLDRVEFEMQRLDCDRVLSPTREDPGAAPVERRPDGQPLITDDLINRWIRAPYALWHTGGGYWQSGQ